MKKKLLSALLSIASTLFLIACDSDSPSQPNTKGNTTSLSGSIDLNEIPQSCTVQTNSDTVFIDLAFQKWTWDVVYIIEGHRVLSFQTFTGLDESFINDLCNRTNNALNSQIGKTLQTARASCNGNVMTEEYVMNESLPTISPVEYANSMSSMCQQLLRGDITMNDNFFP
jgi:hypothetical protein